MAGPLRDVVDTRREVRDGRYVGMVDVLSCGHGVWFNGSTPKQRRCDLCPDPQPADMTPLFDMEDQ